jgi:hypothetical protein
MIGLPTFSWGLALKLAAIAAVLGLVWWGIGRIRVSYTAEKERDDERAGHAVYVARVEKDAKVAAAKQAAHEREDAELNATVEAIRKENEWLHRTVMKLAETVERTDANGNRSVGINPDWMQCAVSAPLGRSPADMAKCKALSGDGGVPDPERHGRVPVPAGVREP